MLSIATDHSKDVHGFHAMQDFYRGIGNPQPYLRAIADAGFSHVHWCHHWRGDFMYDKSEIAYLGKLLDKYGLQVADVHGSEGREKFWYSPQEYARLAGVELVKNRIDFAAHFGGDAVVMHAYPLPAEPQMGELMWTQLCKTLDALQPYALERNVKIAIENLIDFQGVRFDGIPLTEARDNWPLLTNLFARYPPEFLGLCFDSGHAHLGYDRMAQLAHFLDRLIVLHLHDNDGSSDQHRNLFTKTIDWERLAKYIAKSSYAKPMSLEVVVSDDDANDAAFLATAFETGNRFAKMVRDCRRTRCSMLHR